MLDPLSDQTLLVVPLQVVHDHVDKHVRAHTTCDGLVEVVALSQVGLEHEVEGSQLGIAYLHVKNGNDPLVAVFPVEADVSADPRLCVLELEYRDIAYHPFDILERLHREQQSIAFVEEVNKFCRVISDADVNV